MLYKADTPTNVLPSIHVFNSIGVCIAISHNRVLSRRKVIHYGSLVLGISIILATMFLKQHSVIDVTLAGCLATLLYPSYMPENRGNPSRKGTQTIYKESCRRLIYKHRPTMYDYIVRPVFFLYSYSISIKAAILVLSCPISA